MDYSSPAAVAFSLKDIPEYVIWTAVVIACVIGLLMFIKNRILAFSPSEIEFRSVDLNDYPYRNVKGIEDYNSALVDLGFMWLGDFTAVAPAFQNMRSFTRLYYHLGQQCSAEISQAWVLGSDAVPLRCVIGSNMEEGWSLSTTNRDPDGVMYAMRRPRSLWTNQPGASPSALVSAHLNKRKEILFVLGVRVSPIKSLEEYNRQENEDCRIRREAIRRKNILVFIIEAMAFSNNPKYEWMGDYSKIAEKKLKPYV